MGGGSDGAGAGLRAGACGRLPRTEDGDDAAALNADVMRLYQAGKYPEATEIAKRVLAIYEKALGPEHPYVGTSLNNLALMYQAQGRYAEAELLLRRGLAIREKALGPEHPDVGQSLNNLASLYQAQGRYADAEPLLSAALAICEKALGPEHPDVARPQQPGLALSRPGPLCRGRAATPTGPERYPAQSGWCMAIFA